MIGAVLDSKYRIDKQLGAGGMGNVYLATHLGTTRVVAVKVIAPKWASEPQFLARFQREAQACGRLRHPNIVNVTDFGIARSEGGDLPYLVMEFLDGRTLSDFQEENPHISLPLVADILDQIGLALAEAHRYGIVHRDLKPDNVWLEPNGRGGYTVKVLDFGVAKVSLLSGWAAPAPAKGEKPAANEQMAGTDEMDTVIMVSSSNSAARGDEVETVALTAPDGAAGTAGSGARAETMPGSLLGTPAYMSPEQALGREIDFRSDIYSLAVVAYSLVCGALPYTGTIGGLIQYHREGHPAPPADLGKIPRDVSDAILEGLARNPEDRPPSAVAFTRRFHNAVDAEFLALRRSKSFFQQHLSAFLLLLLPIYGTLLSLVALLVVVSRKVMPLGPVRYLLVPAGAAFLLVFANNLLRAAAALMALDEQVRVRRFLSLRVFWRLVKAMPRLAWTQAQAAFSFGRGWAIRDCLWPVVCVVEHVYGKAAVRRSRELMSGLQSAGRALAIRHFALAALAVADAVRTLAVLWRPPTNRDLNFNFTSVWFPIFAFMAAAPLFLYDRTAANKKGPLLQLDRTPEIRITARALSLSSTIWLVVGVLYLLYQPLKLWLFGGR